MGQPGSVGQGPSWYPTEQAVSCREAAGEAVGDTHATVGVAGQAERRRESLLELGDAVQVANFILGHAVGPTAEPDLLGIATNVEQVRHIAQAMIVRRSMAGTTNPAPFSECRICERRKPKLIVATDE